MILEPVPGLIAASRLIRGRTLSPRDLVRACLDRIAARNHDLNAFITVFERQAMADAADAQDEIARGDYRGPLHGIPVSVKDLIDVAGSPTTAGSAVPPRHAVRDAHVVSNLRRAGAIIVGKTNLHEFAFGTTSDESAFGPVRHPLDPSRSPGGSSGGAAVAIVERMCLGSVGTDTGGSIRIPAAACGITGLKPTSGELSCDGIVPLSTTLDHVGPMARTVRDTNALFLAMLHGRAAETPLAEDAGALRIGAVGGYFLDLLDDGIREAFEAVRRALASGGCHIDDVLIEHARHTADVYLHISLPEASWYHAPLLGRYADRYAPGVRLRLELGRYIAAEDYVRALHARSVLTEAVDRALEGRDALMLPTLPIPTPPLGAASAEVAGQRVAVRSAMLRLTQLFDITGHPAIAVPAGTGNDGFPRSIQLVGRRGATARLLEIAAAVEDRIE